MARWSISMPDELAKRIDDVRGDVPRSAWVRGAIRLRAATEPALDVTAPEGGRGKVSKPRVEAQGIVKSELKRASEYLPVHVCPKCGKRHRGPGHCLDHRDVRLVSEGESW